MDNKISKLQKDLDDLNKKAKLLLYSYQNEFLQLDPDIKKGIKKESIILPLFTLEYDLWYSEAFKVVESILPHRLTDFILLYKDKTRKEITLLTYTISDYLNGTVIDDSYSPIIDGSAAINKFGQQMSILKSAKKIFSSSLFDIQKIIQADLFDSELDSAQELAGKGFLRGAGAIAGVVLEKHLRQVCNSHKITVRKKNPTLYDLYELLKSNKIIDVPEWRRIQHLGDLRNLCDHNKEKEPTKDDVEDLIKGVNRVIKNLF